MLPLTNLLIRSVKGKKEGPFILLEPAQEAFNALKEAFTTAPVLCHFNLALLCQVETDSLGFALASVILQLDEGVANPKQCHYQPMAF